MKKVNRLILNEIEPLKKIVAVIESDSSWNC